MDIQIKTEMTPNPNALKFITNVTVINKDRKGYDSADECTENPLAQSVFAIDNVMQVHFFENVVTVTQTGQGDWGVLEDKIRQLLIEKLPTHDPNFHLETADGDAVPLSPELERINAILNQTIRPALQGDGGDLEVVGLEDNMLMVRYQGACGSCPSSTMGTLQAIEGILREQFNPELEVHAV